MPSIREVNLEDAHYIGGGLFGTVYDVGDGLCLKVGCVDEAEAANQEYLHHLGLALPVLDFLPLMRMPDGMTGGAILTVIADGVACDDCIPDHLRDEIECFILDVEDEWCNSPHVASGLDNHEGNWGWHQNHLVWIDCDPDWSVGNEPEFYCIRCDTLLHPDDVVFVSPLDPICCDCAIDQRLHPCVNCGNAVREDDSIMTGDTHEVVCNDCLRQIGGIRLHKCSDCGLYFRNDYELHYNTVHCLDCNPNKSGTCPTCTMPYSLDNLLASKDGRCHKCVDAQPRLFELTQEGTLC